MLVFRLNPNIFSHECVMKNIHLRKYIYNYLNLEDIKWMGTYSKVRFLNLSHLAKSYNRRVTPDDCQATRKSKRVRRQKSYTRNS
jgi:hypothetical protein